MHAVRTIEPGNHPDTPAQAETIERPLWALYVEGSIFLRTPDLEDAKHAQTVALDSGRYEFVDLICEEDRREDERRAPHDLRTCDGGHPVRRQQKNERRQA